MYCTCTCTYVTTLGPEEGGKGSRIFLVISSTQLIFLTFTPVREFLISQLIWELTKFMYYVLL